MLIRNQKEIKLQEGYWRNQVKLKYYIEKLPDKV